METGDRESAFRIWQVGLGPVGRRLVAGAVERGFEVVGASDPEYAGRALGELVDASGVDDVTVASGGVVEEVDIAQVATVSDPEAVADQIRSLLPAAGAVATTCETLAHPVGEARSLAEALDDEARAEGASVLATGVNPGFAMDLFPVFASGASRAIERVEVVRRAEVSDRRGPLQKKVGAGMTPEAFERALERGDVGHRGLEASMRLLGSALGWEIDRVDESIEGVPAEVARETDHVEIAPGDMRGVRHRAAAYRPGDDSAVIRHELVLAVGVDEPVDRVAIHGEPPLEFRVPGGVPGDVCTANVVLNYADVLSEAEPGFHTPVDLPLPRPRTV